LLLRLWLIFHEFRSYLADLGRNVRWGIRQLISSSEGVKEYPAQGLLSYSRGNKFETGLNKFTHALALIDDGNPAQAEAGVRELGELHGDDLPLAQSKKAAHNRSIYKKTPIGSESHGQTGQQDRPCNIDGRGA
tara:strand:- start:5807 stop:6208 length:402 start_codon:yes stop_codon:yes gene_type:complete